MNSKNGCAFGHSRFLFFLHSEELFYNLWHLFYFAYRLMTYLSTTDLLYCLRDFYVTDLA